MKSTTLFKKVMAKGLKPVKKLNASEWADKYRVLSQGNAEPGRWKTSRTPYLREIMDAFTQEGIHRIAVKSSSQIGKALDKDTPIPTPDGWSTMENLKVGDKVFDERGEVCNVIATTDLMFDHTCYEVTFSDREKIVADAGHLWFVHDHVSDLKNKTEKVLSTAELIKNYKLGRRNRYAIPVAGAMNLPDADLPIDPYVLGVWLGDGNSHSAQLTVHEKDRAIIEKIESTGLKIQVRQKDKNHPHVLNVMLEPLVIDKNICIRGHDMNVRGRTKRGYCAECARQHALYHKWKGVFDIPVDPIVKPRITMYGKLRALGVLQNKHIPKIYLRASEFQRLELLRGIMDTDGYTSTKGICEITQKSKVLADDIVDLIRSLGLKPVMKSKTAVCTNAKTHPKTLVWRITFVCYNDKPIFCLSRKFARQKSREGCRVSETERRRITEIKEVASRPVKCIAVDSPNHLYLAGRGMIPTHNSEALLNVFGRFAHLDPCLMMMIQPTLEMAQDFSKSRLAGMIEDTKVLKPLFYGAGETMKTRDATQTILSKFFQGGRLVLAGANSPAGLASRPIRILLCDEVDRFPLSAANEGDPVEIAAKRTTTYWNYKIGLFSTPTEEGASRIDIEYLAGTQEEWRHRCPNCGEYHALDWRQMVSSYEDIKDAAGNRVVLVHAVEYQCPDCGYKFGESEMKRAPQKYFAQNPDALKNGVRSFWLNAFSSPWLSWREIMREWYMAQGNPTLEQVVMNTRFGLSYKLVGEYSDERVFLERREDYGAELPEGVLFLTAAVDVQDNRLEYEVCGWAEGEECWGINKGVIYGVPDLTSTWRDLDAVLDRDYHFADGTPLKIYRTFIDSGGHFTSYVYKYCMENARRGRYAIKGMGGLGLKLIHKISQVKNYPILLTILGVDEGKQQVMTRLGFEHAGAQYFHFPQDDAHLGYERGYDEAYFKGLISEHKVYHKKNGISYPQWEPLDSHARNEPLDLRVYNLACLQSCRVDWKKQAVALRWKDGKMERWKVSKTNSAPKKKSAPLSRSLDLW